MPTPAPTSAAPPAIRASEGGLVLASDIRVALLFCNEARYRVLARLFGTSRGQANLITFVAVLALAQGASDRWRRMMSGPPIPALGDDMLATASLRELLSGVAGLPAGDASQLGTLLMLACLGGLAGPSVIRSARGVRGGSKRLNHAFRHRYGYLVDPGHWRKRRYEAREALRTLDDRPMGPRP